MLHGQSTLCSSITPLCRVFIPKVMVQHGCSTPAFMSVSSQQEEGKKGDRQLPLFKCLLGYFMEVACFFHVYLNGQKLFQSHTLL